jgi:Ion channel
MAVSAGVVGALLILIILVEVFQDLFHPGGSGALSNWVGRRMFNVFRRAPNWLPLAGPLSIIVVILTWVIGLLLGFSLVFVGSMPTAFRTSTGGTPPADEPFISSLYFSFATLTTLGYGDIVPHDWWVRFVSTAEALIGFALLTASVSSIVLLYQGLARMRLLARTMTHLAHAESHTGVKASSLPTEGLLVELARAVSGVRVDLIHFPILYYFATADRDGSIARWTRALSGLATESLASAHDNVRLAAASLDAALTDLARHLGEAFLDEREADRATVFAAFARDHKIQIFGSPAQ